MYAETQIKQPAAIRKQAEQFAAAGAAVGAARPQSEIEREFERLERAASELAQTTETLWARLSQVTSPPTPVDADVRAIEGCNSSLGNGIQAQTMRVLSSTESLRYLLQSLAL